MIIFSSCKWNKPLMKQKLSEDRNSSYVLVQLTYTSNCFWENINCRHNAVKNNIHYLCYSLKIILQEIYLLNFEENFLLTSFTNFLILTSWKWVNIKKVNNFIFSWYFRKLKISFSSQMIKTCKRKYMQILLLNI